MAHLLFYLAVVAACLLWSAVFVALTARMNRIWLRRFLIAVAVIVPPLMLLPYLALTGWFALLNFQTNWFAPTLVAFISALVGGLWIRSAGLSRDASGTRSVAAAWPVVGLVAMFVLAKVVAFGTLLFIDNAVAAEGRMLRVEASQLMAAAMPPTPSADSDAAPLYLRAFAAFASDPVFRDNDAPVTNPLTVDVSTPEVTASLARHAATLELLRRAADRPGCLFVRDWSRPSIDMILPEMQEMRHAARLLALAARRAAADGDVAAALADILRIHRLGMHSAGEPILVSGLVGQAIDVTALETLAAVLPRLGKKDLSLLDTTAFCDFIETPVTYQRAFLGEEAFGLATLADLADEEKGTSMAQALRTLADGKPAASWFDLPLSLLYRCFMLRPETAAYRGILRRYQNIVGPSAGLPPRQFPEVKQQIAEIENEVTSRRDGIFSSLMVPALSGVLKSQARGRALHEAAKVLVAATRARFTTGSVPESAADLVPGLLPALPVDPFTSDQPLRSRRTDDSWLVYSVGPDGEDDGGPPAPGAEDQKNNDDVGLRLPL